MRHSSPIRIPTENDLSYSMMIDRRTNNHDDDDDDCYLSVQGRTPENWIETSSVSSCYACKARFGMGIVASRPHHCRMCARVFCNACCSSFAVIPSFVKRPVPSDKHKNEDVTKALRVCNACHRKLQVRASMVSDNKPECLDVCVLTTRASLANPDVMDRQLAILYLSELREIQYAVPNHVFTLSEKKLLWSNRAHLVGHPRWVVQLVRSVDYDRASELDLQEVLHVLRDTLNHTIAPQCTCWTLMCSRNCGAFAPEHAIQILNQAVRHDGIRSLALSVFEKCTETEMKIFIPYLVRHSLYSPIVYNWLSEHCKASVVLANEFYWEMQCHLYSMDGNRSTCMHLEIINEALNKWNRTTDAQVRDQVVGGANFVAHVREAYRAGGSAAVKVALTTYNQTFFAPTDPCCGALQVVPGDVCIKDSITSPILIATQRVGQPSLGPSLLWKPEDIRADQIVLSIIQLMKGFLVADESLALPIVTYNVRPCSESDGFIEVVPDCASLHAIKHDDKKDLLTWIIDKNEGSSESASALRDRFVQSCAAYCVITYLLGSGDRHLDNIMLKTDGSLFHIDYGFVLGQDPKVMLQKPRMRITQEMLNAMGGKGGLAYGRFQALCTVIYNCLRRHINVFVCLLRLFVEAIPSIRGVDGPFKEANVMKEVVRRFVPGETDQQAEVHLYTQLEDSTVNMFSYDVIDYFHLKAKKASSSSYASLPKSLAHGTAKTVETLVVSLWGIAGFADTAPISPADKNKQVHL